MQNGGCHAQIICHYLYRLPAARSVASTGWAEAVVEYAAALIPKEKISLGLGIYGYGWPDGRPGTADDTAAAQRLAAAGGAVIRTDDAAMAPYFTYIDADGIGHTVWFEDGRSITAKLMLVRKYGLRGAALWRLGLIEPEIWAAFAERLQVIKE